MYFNIPLSLGLLLWPILVIPLILLALGLGMVFSSLNVKYRDIKYTIPFLIQLGLFVTPIIYPISILPEKYKIFVALNPMTGIIEAFRSTVIPNKHIDILLLLYSVIVSLFIFLLGLMYFKKTEKEFADLV